jgi:hypothetical protein
MYLENTVNGKKFYEIVRRKTDVYIFYGKIPLNINKGTFIKYEFEIASFAKQFFDGKTDEKIKRNYAIIVKNTTESMKRAIKLRKPKIRKPPKQTAPVAKKFPRIELKRGELGKHGYKDVKNLTIKKRHEALDKAIDDYGAQTVLKKLGLIKTYNKNKNPIFITKLRDNMKWTRKKYDSQFKSSWVKSALFK